VYRNSPHDYTFIDIDVYVVFPQKDPQTFILSLLPVFKMELEFDMSQCL